MYLKYEFEQKKQEEKEEQQAIKERMREEAKALKELEKAKEKVEKEEKHFVQAIEKMNEQLSTSNDNEKEKLLDKLRELERQLEETKKNKEDVLYRVQNTRAGYVYIISNIGSFGEDVYKIGMTRRLEPMDRVKELGDASVPFTFDVHAMIFSEDAPTLENAIHKALTHKKVNKVNDRKEFFRVSLQEIEDLVKSNHNKTVEFTKLAQAEDYRKSLTLEKDLLQEIS
ncbi:GIY-YIG nuclease family protein [Priestia megaterium]|uniref:GIY-YIG nuclease family protein n=1 Tax=Priestia megaterium TaxID=1404 RepID=UPI000A9BBF01|nr:GIY-YIG nuclease family protein [Priestia megaterium]